MTKKIIYLDVPMAARLAYVVKVAEQLMGTTLTIDAWDAIHDSGKIDRAALRDAAPECDDLAALTCDLETYFLI